jgi:small subunit ribosomal protein S4
MSKRKSAKHKLDRRMGENIWGRPSSPVNRRSYGPGQHGQRRKGKVSDFGLQLRAKQKLKGYYGDVTEKQFKATYKAADRMKGDTGQNLIGLLEQRLDMVVYRAKFAPTVFAARQIVSHGHIRVNGTKCNIASRKVLPGDVVSLGDKRRARRHRQGDLHPRAEARRGAISGDDGTEPGGRVLLALTPSRRKPGSPLSL